VVKKPYVPERGDAVWLDFDPQVGHEQAGRRPALAVSPAAYNGKVGLGLFCPITSQAKGYNWEVSVPKGLKVSGVVLADQLWSCDWRGRKATFICKLPEPIVADVLEKLLPLLEPEDESEGDDAAE
jgi:mRNA interferase MazF